MLFKLLGDDVEGHQLPNGEDVLRRTCDLVRPGGWLLVEDPDDDHMRDGENSIGPGMRAFVDAWLHLLRSRGAEPNIGARLERLLKESGKFSEVHSKKIIIPISGHSLGLSSFNCTTHLSTLS